MNGDAIWLDLDDDATRARGSVTPQGRVMLGSRAGAAFGHDGAIGPRLLGLAILCVALFGLATLVGFAAEAYAAPPGPARIVKASGTLVAQPRVRLVNAPRPEGTFVLRLG